MALNAFCRDSQYLVRTIPAALFKFVDLTKSDGSGKFR